MTASSHNPGTPQAAESKWRQGRPLFAGEDLLMELAVFHDALRELRQVLTDDPLAERLCEAPDTWSAAGCWPVTCAIRSGRSPGWHVRGRHNTLDKVAGECLVRGIPPSDAILLTTGRISTEMLGKAARMQVPVVVTRNSPTHLAIELAWQWDITLIGYARGERMHVYTCWQRVIDR